MRINIGKHWQRKLADLPETGMGSQHIDIYLKSNVVLRDVPVFNGIDCEVARPFSPADILTIQLHGKRKAA